MDRAGKILIMINRFFILTVFLCFPNLSWGQSYNPYGDGGYSESVNSQKGGQENYNQMQDEAHQAYQNQQIQIEQQQVQQQLSDQRQEIDNYNNASPIQRITGDY